MVPQPSVTMETATKAPKQCLNLDFDQFPLIKSDGELYKTNANFITLIIRLLFCFCQLLFLCTKSGSVLLLDHHAAQLSPQNSTPVPGCWSGRV